MTQWEADMTEILRLRAGGKSNEQIMALYEIRVSGQPTWKDPEDFDELTSVANIRRLKPKTVQVGSQSFEIPELIVGNQYWMVNLASPANPVRITYNPSNSTIKAQGEANMIVETKKASIDYGKALQYWLSQGGSK